MLRSPIASYARVKYPRGHQLRRLVAPGPLTSIHCIIMYLMTQLRHSCAAIRKPSNAVLLNVQAGLESVRSNCLVGPEQYDDRYCAEVLKSSFTRSVARAGGYESRVPLQYYSPHLTAGWVLVEVSQTRNY